MTANQSSVWDRVVKKGGKSTDKILHNFQKTYKWEKWENKFQYQCATHVLQKCLDASNAEHVKGGIRVNCKASCTIRCGCNTAKDAILNRIRNRKNCPFVEGKRIRCDHMKTISENSQVYMM